MMSWFKSARAPAASAAAPARAPGPVRHDAALSANAQMWRRLARDGYDRTAEHVRASQPAPLKRNTDSPTRR